MINGYAAGDPETCKGCLCSTCQANPVMGTGQGGCEVCKCEDHEDKQIFIRLMSCNKYVAGAFRTVFKWQE